MSRADSLRPGVLLLALMLSVSAAAMPLAAAPDEHGMPCCAREAGCAAAVLAAPCCGAPAPVQAPASQPPLSLKPAPAADTPAAALVFAQTPPAVATSASLAFELGRLKLPHEPPYLRNVSFRI